MPVRMINLTCTNCGASLDVDLDNMIVYCPFCGQKLMIDADQLSNIIEQKELTKRKDLEYKHEKDMAEMKQKQSKSDFGQAMLTLFIILLLFFILGFLQKINLL